MTRPDLLNLAAWWEREADQLERIGAHRLAAHARSMAERFRGRAAA